MLHALSKPVLSAVCLFGLALLGACSSLHTLDKAPRVSLVNLQTVQIQLLEQRYLATIRIQNPNPVALPIQGLEYTISINGADFANGVSSQRITIPAYGEKTIDLGLTSTLINLLDQFRRFDEIGGKVTYEITGTLSIDGVLGGVGFQRAGEIDLKLERPPRRQAT